MSRGPVYLDCGCVDRYHPDLSLMCEQAVALSFEIEGAKKTVRDKGNHGPLRRMGAQLRRHVHDPRDLVL